MSGVSVGDPAPALHPNVLMEILGSSESVAARIKQYQDAKAEAEKALEALRIGKDAHKAYEDANAKHAEALAAVEQANQHADEAIRAGAEAQAHGQQIVADAYAEATRILDQAEAERAAHQRWLDATKADTEAKAAAAEQTRVEAAQLKAEHVRGIAAAEAAKAEAEAATARVAEAEKKLKAQAAKLQGALTSLSG